MKSHTAPCLAGIAMMLVAATPLSTRAQSEPQSPADRELLQRLPTMTLPQIQEALEAYERVGDDATSRRLLRALEERARTEGGAADALDVARHASRQREADLSARESAAQAAADARREKIAAEAATLLDDANGGEAGALEALRLLEASPFAGPEHPLLRGRALAQAGRYDEAERVLAPLAADPALNAETRADATAALRSCRLEKLRADYGRASQGAPPEVRAAIVEKMAGIAPDDPFTLEAQCATYMVMGNPIAVRELLDRHRAAAESDAGLRSHKADAHIQLGDYEEAITVMRALAADAKAGPDARFNAAQERQELGAVVSAGASAESRYIHEAQGSWWIAGMEVRTARPADHTWQFQANTRVDHTSASSFDSSLAKDLRWDGELEARRWFGRGNYALAAAGVSDEGEGRFSAGATRVPFDRWGGSVRYDHQAPATDCVGMRAINGRENRASVSLEGELIPGLTLWTEAARRSVSVDGDALADGWDFRGSLTLPLLQETASRPHIWASAVSELGRLAFARAQVEDIVVADVLDPRVNRQEIELGLSKAISSRLSVTGSLAGGYDVDDESPVWRIGAGVDCHISDDVMCSVGVQYDSSGVGANTGESMTNSFARLRALW